MNKIFQILIVVFIPVLCALAETDISIRGSGRLFPIALPQLCIQSGESQAAKDVPAIISRDLDLSGYFEVLSPSGFIETPGKCTEGADLVYSDWSVIGAEGLVKGVVWADRSTVKIRMYLHDVQKQQIVLGKEYEGDLSKISSIAHKFANEILAFFTGVPGVFGTRISFSSKVGRFKELYVMDMDGGNVRSLTDDRGLAVSSSWHPYEERLVYTSYRSRVPELFTLDLGNRAIRQLTKGAALELGGKYSRDGQQILLSKAEGDDSNIVLLKPDGSFIRSLTPSNGAIDVSPDWSPDNSRIVFCSNRSGGPQIYVMNADGSSPQRISFTSSSYCTSPAWSPSGDKIAFVCRADRGFQLFISQVDGSNPVQLTAVGDNEDPTWSPDGRYIAFATTFGKGYVFNIGLIRSDGANLRQLTNGRVGDTEPSWEPTAK